MSNCVVPLRRLVKLKRSTYTIPIFALTLFSLVGLPTACFANDGLEIRQTSKMVGPHTIFVTDSAVKIVEPLTAITYLCRKPQWQWQVFNGHTGKYYQCKPEAFTGTACERMVIFLHEKLLKRSFKTMSPAKMMNQSVQRLWAPLGFSATESINPSAGHKQRYFACSLLACDSLPESVRQAIGRIYGVPISGIPLEVTYTDELNAERKALVTVALERKALGVESFAVPKNCSKVQTEREVFRDEERDSDVNQLLEPR